MSIKLESLLYFLEVDRCRRYTVVLEDGDAYPLAMLDLYEDGEIHVNFADCLNPLGGRSRRQHIIREGGTNSRQEDALFASELSTEPAGFRYELGDIVRIIDEEQSHNVFERLSDMA